MPLCIVKGCRNRTGGKTQHPNIVLHGFPNNIRRIKQWIVRIYQDYGDIDKLAQNILEGKKNDAYRMCSNHFPTNCYISKGDRFVLEKDAVPTIFDESHTCDFPPHKKFRGECQAEFSSKVPVPTGIPTYPPYNCIYTQTNREFGCQTEGTMTELNHLKSCGTQTDPADYTSTSCTQTISVSVKDEYIPSPSEIVEIVEEEDVEEDWVKEKKFIVFESCLDILLDYLRCSKTNCYSSVVEMKKNVVGSFLSVTGKCSSGHFSVLWQSQPTCKKIPLGNLILSSAILLSGSQFNKVSEMMSICGIVHISKTTYNQCQRRYLFPAVDLHWIAEEQWLKREFKDKALCLTSDGQCDDHRHRAKYCTYVFMDIATEKILKFKVVRSGDTMSSFSLEKKAFVSCLNDILKDDYNIQMICTDRHEAIKKSLREDYGDIIHRYDTWHFAKCLHKKLVTESSKKSCKALSRWVQPIVNHFWWSAQTCKGNPDLLREKFTSVLKHVVNVHKWEDGELYHACTHQHLSEEEKREIPWINPRDPSIDRLERIFNKQFLQDLNCLQLFCHTRGLQAFHGKLLKYRPKKNRFGIKSMEARTKLAVLFHNRNVEKQTALIEDEKRSNNILDLKIYRCPTYQPTHNTFLLDIARDAVKICRGQLTHSQRSSSGFLPPNILLQMNTCH
ncbi:uncharacterized protein RCH25_053012 [Pelodytes ibericus]